jgi:hypothetical protein
MVSANSSNDLGTSIDKIMSVRANANTASLNVSKREGSWLRQAIESECNLAAFVLSMIS